MTHMKVLFKVAILACFILNIQGKMNGATYRRQTGYSISEHQTDNNPIDNFQKAKSVSKTKRN